MKNKKIYIFFTILISILCVVTVGKTIQNDTYSAIRIGDYILHNGIDFVEHFNFNELFYHNARWLFNVIIALIYNKFNFFGVYLFAILGSITLGLTIFNCLLKKNKNYFLSFIITVLSIYFISGCLTARAQIISYLLLFLELLFIEKLIKSDKKKYIFVISLISILIANIHTTIWPMTLILFMPYFAEYIISKFLKKPKILYFDEINIKTLIITFLIVLVSGLLTPLGFLPYTYMFKTLSGGSSQIDITELKIVNPFTNVSLFFSIIIYVYLFVYLKRKIKISDIFLVSGLFIMAVMAYRNIPFFIILCTISLSRLIIDNTEKYKEKIDKIFNYIYEDKIIISLITIVMIVLCTVLFYRNIYKKSYVADYIYPTKAADYIVNNLDLDNLRLYNSFNNGSYLEFRGIKVFLDSRSEVYCKEFNNTNILLDWYMTENLKTDYKYTFNEYNFNYILLYIHEPLNYYVSKDIDYKIIYVDNYFVLYEKVE